MTNQSSEDLAQKIHDLEKVIETLPPEFRAPLEATLQTLIAQQQQLITDVQVEQPETQPLSDIRNLPPTITNNGHMEGVVVAVNHGTITYTGTAEENVYQKQLHYLERLSHALYHAPLRGLEKRLDQGEGIALPQIYVMLATTDNTKDIDKDTNIDIYFEDGDIFGYANLDYSSDWALPDIAVNIYYDYVGPLELERIRIQQQYLVTDKIQEHSRLILCGEPGSGKSTFIRHFAWVLATQQEKTQTPILAPPEGNTYYLPIILPLRSLAGFLARDGLGSRTVFDAFVAELRAYDVVQAEDMLEAALAQNTTFLLLDGLDEVPVEEIPNHSVSRGTTLRMIRDFLRQYPMPRAVITCRTRAFDQSLEEELDWPKTVIAPFTLGQIRHFVPAWYQELVRCGQLTSSQAYDMTQRLLDTIISSPKLQEMASTPLLLTMMALVVFNNGVLPRDKPQLYERILELLLGQWDKVRDGQSLGEAIGLPDWGSERIRPILEQLSFDAHRMASSEDGRGRLQRSQVRDAIEQFFCNAGMRPKDAAAMAVTCLDYFNHRSGLLVPDNAHDSYVFAHLTLQEYCAGRALMLSPNPSSLVMQYRQDDRWREPIMLGLGSIQQSNPYLIGQILQDLIDTEEQGILKPLEQWVDDIFFAVDIGEDRDWLYLKTQGINTSRLKRDMQTCLMNILKNPSNLPAFSVRLQVTSLLSRLGDPRFPVTTEEWQKEIGLCNRKFGSPDGYWCYVRPGSYRIGGWVEEQPSAVITLPEFWVATFPITIAQFLLFDEEGWNNEEWWTPQGWIWQQDQMPSGLQYTSRIKYSEAIVAITWYEATAFCNWLSSKIAHALPEGYCIRLPTEAEWEAASAYNHAMERHRYPWHYGVMMSENIVTVSIEDNPAVGLFPEGAAACGALDFAGTVWELTTSAYESYPWRSNHIVSDYPLDTQSVVWRGGYQNDGFPLGNNSRDNKLREMESKHIGFRVVLAPKPPTNA
jgi:formylglycine-generating enzyme required for sulfatase activity/energy-coupling factor transporter ATP-binding protein EcfA2